MLPRQIGVVLAMPFSASTIEVAWSRSGAVCECRDPNHGHQGRCATRLLWTLQGGELNGGWRACRKTAWGMDGLSNCEIRCARCEGVRIWPAE